MRIRTLTVRSGVLAVIVSAGMVISAASSLAQEAAQACRNAEGGVIDCLEEAIADLEGRLQTAEGEVRDLLEQIARGPLIAPVELAPVVVPSRTSNADPYVPVFIVSPMGVVVMGGALARAGSPGNLPLNETLFRIPEELRPGRTLFFLAACDDNLCQLTIASDGAARISGIHGENANWSWLGLSGLSFVAANHVLAFDWAVANELRQ